MAQDAPGTAATTQPAAPAGPSTQTQAPTAQVEDQASQTAPAEDNVTGIQDIIVTAQKRSETLQDVPIAVSAFSEQSLRAQGLDGASNLVQSIPNVSFQRRGTRNNFQIRGIGTQLSALSGDDGVGVHQNNVPLTSNRLGEAEFFDVERVEVLRGPQGTLYGRNATGGVVNVITNKPTSEFSGSATVELGNYGSARYFGYINAPITDTLNLRVAGFGLQRDGYVENLLTGGDLDSRNIFSGRITLGFEPSSTVRAYFMYEGFSENDNRSAAARKQLCLKDPGPSSINGVATGATQVAFTAGCQQVGVYGDNVYGTTNQLSTFSGILARQFGIQPRDSLENKFVSRDLRETEVVGRPLFRAVSDLFTFSGEIDIAEGLTISSLTSYNENHDDRLGDATGGYSSVTFPISPLLPNGLATSAQMGVSDRLRYDNGLFNDNKQFSEELRLQSSFDGPFNFNVGGIYLKYKAHSITYVNSTVIDTLARAISARGGTPIYIDPNPFPDFTGHNYFQNNSYFDLESAAVLGELYYELTDTLKVTAGARYTDDNKKLLGARGTLLVPGQGLSFFPEQETSFREVTGRLNVDWSPVLSFTDKTLIYASVSRGYKGGGFNSPLVAEVGLPAEFEPEFVNALEVGTKNTLANGRLILNVTGFYYDYTNYQIARSVNRSSFVQNIDTTVAGVEFEGIAEPIDGLRINANIGYLHTKITEGEVVDTFYRTQGDPTYVYANGTNGGCILNAAGVATALQNPAVTPVLLGDNACKGPATFRTALATRIPAATAATLTAGIYDYGPNVAFFSNGSAEGVLQDLEGNELPNAPKLTISVGAQYGFDLGDSGWNATIRGDYYRQSRSFARYNNAFFDDVRPWSNINASLIFARPDDDWSVLLFVKNLQNKANIVGFEIADENLGAYRTLAVTDPRLLGVAVTKGF
ncbi:TonB-dependent receptor [Sphingomonas corticis]|uniref:TonB-dependent receptor n=1 Tax=Sphingomonas corticis TaxID=2722791 RepID=A0ABX1CQ15_9SPHN|nr:TonB-dependent receptor [Sphingomonas corticis]NJR80031.1 TonB-dependent receptor [Sphingomonas corticis]